MLKMDLHYKNKLLHFKDTLPILSCKLSALPSMFGLENIQKELFPYNYYTIDRLKKGIGNIFEAGKYEIRPWNDKEYEIFIQNINNIEGCRLSENTFNMWSYAIFYCDQDVRILREGFNSFREGFKQSFNIDPLNYISISSLANEVFNENVYYPVGKFYKVGGHVRHFLSRAVYGGRCMCAYNKKWHITKKLCDFDAVSLYPSAMARLNVVIGKPKVIPDDKLNLEFLTTTDAYVIEIKITKVHKHYPFPLIVQKVNGLNLNDDNITEPLIMVVDNITLEDLIEFQEIEFQILRGYYWNEGTDSTIQEIIQKIFDQRVIYK